MMTSSRQRRRVPHGHHQHQRGRFGPGPNSAGPTGRHLDTDLDPHTMHTDPHEEYQSACPSRTHGAAVSMTESPAVTIARLSEDKWARRQHGWTQGSSADQWANSNRAPSRATFEDPMVAPLKQDLWAHSGIEAPMKIQDKAAESEARRPNSTSSIFATATISQPDANHIVHCMASVLHVQIEHDAGAPEELKSVFLSLSDENIRGGLEATPSVMEIHAWIFMIYSTADMTVECIIIALVYINRALALSGMPLGSYNWRPVTLVAFILAQKVWDDRSVRASCFSLICPEYSKEVIKRYEIAFLRNLEYSGVVTRELYTRYYFELRDLFEMANHGRVFPVELLTHKRAEQLEICSSGFRLKAKKKSRSSRRREATAMGGGVASHAGSEDSSLAFGSATTGSTTSSSSARSTGNRSVQSTSSAGASSFTTAGSGGTNATTTTSSSSASRNFWSWSNPSTARRNIPAGNPPRGRDPSQTMTWEDATMKMLRRYIQS
mmetsp:Transcript_11363/g.30586  ORF Transcript_11363/g.30586 Transcript_11363/m.30586 type:complete len:493 (-) Transcript_11363:299-1777(-)